MWSTPYGLHASTSYFVEGKTQKVGFYVFFVCIAWRCDNDYGCSWRRRSIVKRILAKRVFSHDTSDDDCNNTKEPPSFSSHITQHSMVPFIVSHTSHNSCVHCRMASPSEWLMPLWHWQKVRTGMFLTCRKCLKKLPRRWKWYKT